MFYNKTVESLNHIPAASMLNRDNEKYDYWDSYRACIKEAVSIDRVSTHFLSYSPAWIRALSAIRDLVMRPFEGRENQIKRDKSADYYPVGAKAVLFTVLQRNENELIMGESDSILDFKLSILKEEQDNNVLVTVTTVVKFRNIWGKIYFAPVKPAHRLMAKSTLKATAKAIETGYLS